VSDTYLIEELHVSIELSGTSVYQLSLVGAVCTYAASFTHWIPLQELQTASSTD